MGVEIPVGYGLAVLQFSVAGKTDRMNMTLGYATTAEQTPGDAAVEIRNIWSGSTAPFPANQMFTGWSFDGVSCTQMYADGPIVGQSLVTVAGTVTGSTLPPNCSILVRKHTNRGGRKGRGRFFMPAATLQDSAVDNAGNVTAAVVTDWNSRLGVALSNMVGGGLQPVLLHSDLSDAPNNITSFAAQGVIATQRRRLR